MANRGRHEPGNVPSTQSGATDTTGAATGRTATAADDPARRGTPTGERTRGGRTRGQGGTRGEGTRGERSLSALSNVAHQDIERLIDASQHAQQVADDPRRALLASDAAVAAVSAHLAVMEATVYPEMGRRLPGGKARVRTLRLQARDVDSVARGIEQVIYGDVHRPAETIAALRDELAEHLDVHARAEDALVAELEGLLDDTAQRRLAGKVEAQMRHAPTRPHPRLHFPTRIANRFAMNVAGRWDHVLDTMDARSAAGSPVRAPAPPGLWGWYLLGRTTEPEEPESQPETEAGTEAETEDAVRSSEAH